MLDKLCSGMDYTLNACSNFTGYNCHSQELAASIFCKKTICLPAVDGKCLSQRESAPQHNASILSLPVTVSDTQQVLHKCVLNCTEPQTSSEQRLLVSASVPPVFSQTTITGELLVTADEIKGWVNKLVKLLPPKSKSWILGPAFHPGSLVLFCHYFITVAL